METVVDKDFAALVKRIEADKDLLRAELLQSRELAKHNPPTLFSRVKRDSVIDATYHHLINCLIASFKPAKELVITFTPQSLIDVSLLDRAKALKVLGVQSLTEELVNEEGAFDFILGEFPMGVRHGELTKLMKQEFGFVTNAEWYLLFKTLGNLSETGQAFFPVMPALFFQQKSRHFLDELDRAGFRITGVFELPSVYQPETPLCPYLVSISRSNSENLFLADARDYQNHAAQIANFKDGSNSQSLELGTSVQRETFLSFSKYRADLELAKFRNQFAEFKSVRIKDIAQSINRVRSGESFTDQANAIYFPMIGSSGVAARLTECKIKHHNYYQIVLNDSVHAEYISHIFKSKLGQAIRATLFVGMLIDRVPIQVLEDATIPLPNKSSQRDILDSVNKMERLKDRLSSLESELSVNPMADKGLAAQVDNMLAALDLESDLEKIRRRIRRGESKTLELKQTFSLDVKKSTKEKYIELSCLKTIVGFLNSDGGELYVGVQDDGLITGLDLEIEQFYGGKQDNFLNHVKNRIKDRVGEQFYPFINYKMVKVGESCHLLLVECKPATKACFLDGTDFYVRTNPATDKLEGPKLVEYIQAKFG